MIRSVVALVNDVNHDKVLPLRIVMDLLAILIHIELNFCISSSSPCSLRLGLLLSGFSICILLLLLRWRLSCIWFFFLFFYCILLLFCGCLGSGRLRFCLKRRSLPSICFSSLLFLCLSFPFCLKHEED